MPLEHWRFMVAAAALSGLTAAGAVFADDKFGLVGPQWEWWARRRS